jgi:hypothetical protein
LAGITFPSTNKRQEDTDMKKQNAMKSDWIATASTLSKALPYLQRYDDAIVVIKFGGHAMGSDEAYGKLCARYRFAAASRCEPRDRSWWRTDDQRNAR